MEKILKEDHDRLRTVLVRLISRIHYVHKNSDYQYVWFTAQMHNGPYAGPQYADELKAAESALVSDE